MKKIIFMIFIFNWTIFAAVPKNEFKNIKTFSAIVTEKISINNRKTVKKYSILAELPDHLRKIMISPEINSGEVYLYDKNQKLIYSPILEQTIKQKISENENLTLKFIKDLQSINSNSDFIVKKNKDKIVEIIYSSGIRIKFLDFSKINSIEFPNHIKIYDQKIEVSELFFEEIKINIPINSKDFSINEIIKN